MNTFYEPTPKSEKLMIWICSIVGVLAVIGFLKWTADRDEKLSIIMDKYDACLMREYGKTSWQLYQETNGHLPECR